MGNQDQHAEYRLLKDSSEWHPALGGKRTPGSHNPRVPGRGAELAYFEAWFEDKMDGTYAWPRAKCFNNRIITNVIAPKLKKSGKPEGRRRTLQADPRTRLDLGLRGEKSPHPKAGNTPRPSPEIAIGGAQHLLCIFVVYPWSLLWSLTASMNL